jgi:hypothetical protein
MDEPMQGAVQRGEVRAGPAVAGSGRDRPDQGPGTDRGPGPGRGLPPRQWGHGRHGEGGRRGAMVIRIPQGPTYGWRRSGRWQRLAIGAGKADLLRVTAAQGLLKSSVQVTVQQDLPAQSAVLLSVIGGFLALRELQPRSTPAPRSAGSSPPAPDSGVDVTSRVDRRSSRRARTRRGPAACLDQVVGGSRRPDHGVWGTSKAALSRYDGTLVPVSRKRGQPVNEGDTS